MKKPLIIVFRIFIIVALYFLVRLGLTEYTDMNEYLARFLALAISFFAGYEFIGSKVRESTAKENLFAMLLGILSIIIVFSIISAYYNNIFL